MTCELEEAFIKTDLPDVINLFLLLRGVARIEMRTCGRDRMTILCDASAISDLISKHCYLARE
jgi:hypothetical protein